MRYSHPRSKEIFDQISRTTSQEERINIFKQEWQFAREQFPVQLAKLETLLLEYNPFMILVTFAFVDLGYLPEVGRSLNGEDYIEQYHIEIVQALILCHEETEFRKRPCDPPQFQEL